MNEFDHLSLLRRAASSLDLATSPFYQHNENVNNRRVNFVISKIELSNQIVMTYAFLTTCLCSVFRNYITYTLNGK